MRKQQGSLRKKNGSWVLRLYVTEIGPDGKPQRRQVTKTLARVCDDYRTKSDLDDLVASELARVNRGSAAEGSLTLAQFADQYWLPTVKAKRRASTYKFYSDLFDNHLRDRVGDVRLRDFETVHAQRVLDDIKLSQSSLNGIKVGMSALISHALRLGFIRGHNPVHEARPEGSRTDFEGAAYTTDDVTFMLGKVEGVARAVVATAAFTGLRLAELKGLQWADYDSSALHVRRSVWRKNVNQTKTPESKSTVPVIAPLRRVLDDHKKTADGAVWMFQGARGFALNLDNLMRREIHPAVGDRWHGWHAFRRGLSTVLFDLGVDPEVAATILRHSDSRTTRRHYIKLQSQKQGAAAMLRLENALRKKAQTRPSKKRAQAKARGASA